MDMETDRKAYSGEDRYTCKNNVKIRKKMILNVYKLFLYTIRSNV